VRLRLAALLPFLVFLTVLGGTVPAHAANDTIDVVGTLLDNRDDPPKPVPGVNITVEESGSTIAEGVSDAEGKFSIALPGAPIDLLGKKITVKIDTDSLPEGTSLTDEKKTEYSVTIRTDGDIPIGYRIGPKSDENSETVRKISQSALNGLFLGLLLALASLGISLVCGTTGLSNFAHGELITFGAITAFLFQDQWGWAFIPAALVAIVLSGLFGYANDKVLWKPLRRRGTGLLAMMIISIGLAIFLRNVYQYIVGADSHQFTEVGIPRAPWELGPIDLSPRLFWTGVICAIVLVIVSLAVQRTRLGKATRAVSDNPALAASSGIDVDRVILTVWIVGTALAGTSGILWGINYGFDYQFGFKILLLVFAGVTLGGFGTIWGAMAGSVVVGLMVEMSSLILPPEIKYVTALVVLILVLLIRPQGLLGRAQRVG
jgi:branched-chain amino acid transport system permease protein